MVSIVIPAYNAAPFLRECLDSVRAQSFTDWEAVVVDDGSTDSTPDITQAYADADSRFRLLRKPNGGLSSARNHGVAHSTGEWVTFLDSVKETGRQKKREGLLNENSESENKKFKTK